MEPGHRRTTIGNLANDRPNAAFPAVSAWCVCRLRDTVILIESAGLRYSTLGPFKDVMSGSGGYHGRKSERPRRTKTPQNNRLFNGHHRAGLCGAGRHYRMVNSFVFSAIRGSLERLVARSRADLDLFCAADFNQASPSHPPKIK